MKNIRWKISLRPSLAGIVGAHVASWSALSPSLIPRTWAMTALNTALNQGVGYAVGSLVGTLSNTLHIRYTRRNLPRWVTTGSAGIAAAGTIVSLIRNTRHQRELSGLVDISHDNPLQQSWGLAVGTAVNWIALIGFRSLQNLYFNVSIEIRQTIRRFLGPSLATIITGSVVIAATALVNRELVVLLFRRLAHRAEIVNSIVLKGRRPPAESERSGSPHSAEKFMTLGAHGQAFVNDGPRALDISAVTDHAALTPIRVYAGRISHPTVEDAVNAVIRELHRTSAFDRSVLTLFTGTGTGWVQEWAVEAIEFLTRGNCASAAVQYTFVPSAVAFLTERERAEEAGKLLFEKVRAELLKRPEHKRPKLFVSGESLGAFGSQAAFSSADELLHTVNGAVWAGTPRTAELWRSLISRRSVGSSEISPIIDEGRHIRFATNPAELWFPADGGSYLPWESPRIVYAQHASDPIVWWSPRLIWKKPDWLKEPVGSDVATSLRWVPWVTFWQLSVDMARSISVPGGHGHNYHEELVYAWNAVLDTGVTSSELGRICRWVRRHIQPH